MNLTEWVRIEASRTELDRLEREIDRWLEHRVTSDVRRQHQTQLLAVKADLCGALANLRAGLIDDESKACTIEEVYDGCRRLDHAVVMLRRLWEFYREKLDQRDDARLSAALAAADEMVWSCHRGAMSRAAEVDAVHGKQPAPLAYFAPDYSPAALESDQPLHGELRLRAPSPELQPFVDNPAFPVLRLPSWCVESPWWLVFIAHEVGHHVQHDLGLVGCFRERVEDRVRERAGEAAATRWGGWGQEIFADLFSIAMIGPVAIRAMLELEWSSLQAMAKRRDPYPPVIVRLELMAQFAESLAMNPFDAFPYGRAEVDPADASLRGELDLVPVVVALASQPLGAGIGTLEELASIDDKAIRAAWFDAGGECEQWGAQLASAWVAPARALHTARLVTAGTVLAWQAAVKLADASARTAALDALRENALRALAVTGPLGVRAGHLAPPERGAELARHLLQTSAKIVA